MGRRKIIWSDKAKFRLFEIMEYFARRNKSKTYSVKLYQRFQKELSLLIKQPEIGIKTDIESVRGLIVDDYILFYESDNEGIIVHSLWDCKQNPNDLRIK